MMLTVHRLTPVTAPVFSNVTLFGPYSVSASAPNSNYKRAMHLRRSTQLSVYNSVFVGWPKGLIIDGSQGIAPTNATGNILQIEKTILAGMVANFESTPATFGNPPVASNIVFLATDAQAYFEATSPARGNDDTKTVADILGTQPAFTYKSCTSSCRRFTTPYRCFIHNLKTHRFQMLPIRVLLEQQTGHRMV